jgi:hypothetical protein
MAVGLVFNVCLYFEDIYRNNGVLNKIHRGDTVIDLLSSPTPEQKRSILSNNMMQQNVKEYMMDPNKRSLLKKSIGAVRR